jgi:hypothetical protein
MPADGDDPDRRHHARQRAGRHHCPEHLGEHLYLSSYLDESRDV